MTPNPTNPNTHSQRWGEGEIAIGQFSESDLTEAMGLKEQANWNQTENDWHRLLNLGPQGCFAAHHARRVIGTVTTVTYGRELSWIGMMLVDPGYRRRGVGTRLMQTALDYLQGIGVTSIKLDATALGRSLYETLGFMAEGMIEHWEGVAPAVERKDLLKIDPQTRPTVYALDRLAFGADRRPLLDSLINDSPVAPLMVMTPKGQLDGYALARPGSNAFYVGPVVAMSKESALSLFDGMLSQLAGKKVYLNFHTGFGIDSKVLSQRGFVKKRDLIRMRFSQESSAGTSNLIFGIAGPEVG